MSDLPHGDWSPLIVGHQWPGQVSLAALSASAERRDATAAAHTSYADTLRSIRTGLLNDQVGLAAEATQRAFHAGESTAQDIAARNHAKRDAYRAAHLQVAELRSALSDIAEAGNAEINRIQHSGLPLAEKISAIVHAVVTGQEQANAKAAACSAGLFDAIQLVLTSANAEVSARQFSGSHGVELHSAFRSPHPDRVRPHVERALESPAPSPGPEGVGVANGAAGTVGRGGPEGSPNPAHHSRPAAEPATPIAHTPSAPPAGGGADSAASATGARAVIANVTGAVQLNPYDCAPPESVRPAPSPTSIAEVAYAVAAPTIALPITTGPASPPAGVGITTAAHSTSAALPSYGADSRLPTATAPPAPWLPSSAAPVSAPLNPANPAGSLNTPAVVRQQSRPSLRSGSDSGLTEKAVAAKPAEHHLRRLLHAVARQQPRLGWAIGERPDGRPVLLSDLAGGWVPPGITIPVGVYLPEPANRRSGLRSLLDDPIEMLIHQPGHSVPPDDDADALPVSVHARDVASVADLGWELSRSTSWRDGLPRLAQTIARAATLGTGLLDSELELLREELHITEARVLAGYPDAVNADEVGNWQLLAAIDALAHDEMPLAHYHFAWFAAVS